MATKFPLEKYESFLQVMNDTEQEHVANLLRARTEEGQLPLLNTRHDRLEKIRHKIAHVICTDSELIAELRSFKAISVIDVDEIRAEKVEYVKSSKLISAIMRRSNQCYNRFQDALRKTLQTVAAEFLNEGEMPVVHLNNKRPDMDESLSFTFNEAIRNNSGNDTRIHELITEMNEYGLTPVKAIPGQSILIFIYYKTVQNAVKFTQLFNSGILQYILDSIFYRLLLTIEPRNRPTKELNSLISLEDEEIATLEEFTGIEGWKTQRLGRLTFFGKKSERDATTQTDDNVGPTETEITDTHSEDEFLDDYYLNKYGSRKQGELESTNRSLDDCVALKRKFEVSQKKNDTIKKLLEHQTPAVELPVKFSSDPILVQAIRTKTAEDKKKGIRGLTILDNELFVVTGESSEVEVYDSKKFIFSRRWNLRELIQPQDIGSCDRNKCLYIVDSKVTGQSKEILRVEPNGMLIKIWPTGDNFAVGLSVTYESNIILAVYKKNKLSEYSSDGQLIREVIPSSDAGIHFPWHAIKLTNGHFVISHGFGYNDQHKVSIVDANGMLQKSFGGKCGSTIELMNSPVYLSVDGSGFVMVGDRRNSRVLLLDPDLKFRKIFLSKEKHKLGFAQRILLDESNGQLFVSDFDGRGGHILIFRLSN